MSRPGAPHDSMLSETISYVVGLGLALLLTGISFWVASTSALWGPGVAVGLVVLAIAQMGVHLVFFLHITSGPDNTNNVLALAFGVLIVFLVMVGTIWIMAHMNSNMGREPGDHEPADRSARLAVTFRSPRRCDRRGRGRAGRARESPCRTRRRGSVRATVGTMMPIATTASGGTSVRIASSCATMPPALVQAATVPVVRPRMRSGKLSAV